MEIIPEEETEVNTSPTPPVRGGLLKEEGDEGER